MSIDSMDDVARAGAYARAMAGPDPVAGRIAARIAAALGANILRHAQHGELDFRRMPQELVIAALDEAPHDPAAREAKPDSEEVGLGGLNLVRRIAGRFELSAGAYGTVARASVYLPGKGALR